MLWQKITELLRKSPAPASLSAECPDEALPEIVELEIRDVIDLHSFPPRQISAIVDEYLLQARLRRFRYVRIIHGKGIGVQRKTVRDALAKCQFVIEFHDAPPEAGGWGATIAELTLE